MKGQCSNIVPKLSALVVCLAFLSGCSLVRKVTSRPGQDVPQTETKDEAQASGRTILVSPKEDKTIPAEKIKRPSEKIEARQLTREDKSTQKRIIRIAKTKLGCRYQSAGKGPNSFDCSGFTGFVFRQVGISLGASSRDQFLQGRPIEKGEPLRTGDLVFWNGRRIGNTVGHVGIVVDYDESTDTFTFIHAAVSTGVEIQKSTAEYYARRYMGARRILDDIPAGTPEEPEAADTVVEAPAGTASASSSTPAAEQPEPVYHTIKSGDTLSALAVRYHTTVNRICSFNGISSKTVLKIGRRLRVK